MPARRGATLAELLVAMTMLGVIGATAAGTLTYQGRIRTRIVGRLAAEVQLREAVAPLLADLGAASPAGGDFIAGQAGDTALEIRATIAAAHACAVGPSPTRSVDALAPSAQQGRTVLTGDSVWLYEQGAWSAAMVDAVVQQPERTACTAVDAAGGVVLRIAVNRELQVTVGAPLRFTRRVRYSLYRASDSRTYLGLREWAARAGAFSGIQPVAGPFDPRGSRFQYYDSIGTELRAGFPAGPQLGAVRVELRAERPRWTASHDTAHVPRASVVVGLRNRR